jgi:hypothetical protein
MSKGPSKDDPTSLGNVLLELGIITQEQLDHALKEQETLRGDDLLGRLLIASGACTEEEVMMAMSAQESMRAKGKHKCAMAVADLALERRRRQSVIVKRNRLIEKGEQVRKSITGDVHPAVTPAMLAKTTDST